MNVRLMQRLAFTSAALVFLIVSASAFLRLAQTGLGCTEWPSCYGSAQATEERLTPPTTTERAVRWSHRVAASLLVVLLVLMAFPGWKALPGFRARVVVIMLLALAALLAWLGRMTPSVLPAVTLANLAGGFLMFGLLAWLVAAFRRVPEVPVSLRALAWVLLAGVALQVVTGGLMSARLAATACADFPLCAVSWPAVDWRAFDPFAETSLPAQEASADAFHAIHRVVGAALVLAALYLAYAALRARAARTGLAAGIAALMLVQAAGGLLSAIIPSPLVAAVAHNALAAVLVALLFAFIARRAEEKP